MDAERPVLSSPERSRRSISVRYPRGTPGSGSTMLHEGAHDEEIQVPYGGANEGIAVSPAARPGAPW